MRRLLLLAVVFIATPAYAQTTFNSTPPVTAAASGAPVAAAPQPTPGEGEARSLFALAPRQLQIGGRFSSVSGDPARWQRYEDLRDGLLVTAFRFGDERESNGQSYFVTADNVGWRDQRYVRRFDLPGARRFAVCFCTQCGTRVPHRIPGTENYLVPAGILDSSPDARPSGSIFWSSRAPWYLEPRERPIHEEK